MVINVNQWEYLWLQLCVAQFTSPVRAIKQAESVLTSLGCSPVTHTADGMTAMAMQLIYTFPLCTVFFSEKSHGLGVGESRRDLWHQMHR